MSKPFCKYWDKCSHFRKDSFVCNHGQNDMRYCGIYEGFE